MADLGDSRNYDHAFEFLDHMAKVIEEDCLTALEWQKMHWNPRETTLAVKYGGIARDIRKLAKLLHEAFRYECERSESFRDRLTELGERR